MSSYVQLFSSEAVSLYLLDEGGMHFQGSGTLEVFQEYGGAIFFKLNDFQYEVIDSQEVLASRTDPQFRLVLKLRKYPRGQWIIKINHLANEIVEWLRQKNYLEQHISPDSEGRSNQSNQSIKYESIKGDHACLENGSEDVEQNFKLAENSYGVGGDFFLQLSKQIEDSFSKWKQRLSKKGLEPGNQNQTKKQEEALEQKDASKKDRNLNKKSIQSAFSDLTNWLGLRKSSQLEASQGVILKKQSSSEDSGCIADHNEN